MAEIMLEVFCEDRDCCFNVQGHCSEIGTLLLAVKIHGLPAPLTCDHAEYTKCWNEYN